MKGSGRSIARIAVIAAILVTRLNDEAHAGAGMGALIGANTGVLVGLSMWYLVPYGGYGLVYAPLVGCVAGAVIGAGVASTPPRESSEALEVGDRVRLSSPVFEQPIVGRIVDADDTQITVSYPDADAAPVRRTIDRSALDRIERSQGKQSYVASGILIGAGLGAYAGSELSNQGYSRSKMSGAIVGSVVGALVGGTIGSNIRTEHWKGLPTDAEIGLQVGGPSTPLALGVHMSF